MFKGKIGKSLKKVKVVWGTLDKTQKISVLSLVFLLLVLPLGVLVALSPVKLFSRAQLPITPPISAPVTPSPRSTVRPTITPSPYATIMPTPSPRVTSTPSPIVTLIPTPTNPPTVVPTPVASPKPNNQPRISTLILATGKVGRNYRATVVGYDKDRMDNLTMIISNLPPGLSYGSCTNSINLLGRKVIRCRISGRPNVSGNYRVDVTLFDGTGGVAQKSLLLRVSGPGYIRIPPFFNFF